MIVCPILTRRKTKSRGSSSTPLRKKFNVSCTTSHMKKRTFARSRGYNCSMTSWTCQTWNYNNKLLRPCLLESKSIPCWAWWSAQTQKLDFMPFWLYAMSFKWQLCSESYLILNTTLGVRRKGPVRVLVLVPGWVLVAGLHWNEATVLFLISEVSKTPWMRRMWTLMISFQWRGYNLLFPLGNQACRVVFHPAVLTRRCHPHQEQPQLAWSPRRVGRIPSPLFLLLCQLPWEKKGIYLVTVRLQKTHFQKLVFLWIPCAM